MSTPWDHLRRDTPTPQPISKSGTIVLAGGARVVLTYNAYPRLKIFSAADANSAEFGPVALLQMSELCRELAKQHEG
jgi:hypothetical protein